MLAKLSKKALGFGDNFGMDHACKDGQVDKDIDQQASSGGVDGTEGVQVEITKWHQAKCIQATVIDAILGTTPPPMHSPCLL